MRTERPRALELVLAGAASLALLCLVHSVRGVTARTELADVSVDTSSLPSYYGGQSLANPATSYPDMGIAGASSLAATNPSMNVVPGQQLGDMCGGSTAAVTLCSSFLPAAGVAAAPYLHPASPSYGYYGPNTFQDPTKWNGDHVLAGGMQEWAAEDAAQHALNLANWRIKLLQAKLEQAKLASQVMNVGDEQTNYLLARKQVAQPAELQLKAMKRQLVSLVGTTSKEIHALTERAAQQGQRASRHPRRSTVLRTRSSKHSHESYKSKLEALKKSTDKKLADILAQIDKISN